MARARLLKPGFFQNETLAELRPPDDTTTTPASSFAARLCFEGLWVLADKQGRLEDRPKRIKSETFPYDNVDVDRLLDALAAGGFIVRYTVDRERYIAIPKFLKHQSPHVREAESRIPAPGRHRKIPDEHRASTRQAEKRTPVPVPVPVPESVPDPESESEALSGSTSSAAKNAARHGLNNGKENPEENVGIITKIAHEAIELVGATSLDLPDTVKHLCGTRGIPYNSNVVGRAIDSAHVQRSRR
jgi:hypothetical protein